MALGEKNNKVFHLIDKSALVQEHFYVNNLMLIFFNELIMFDVYVFVSLFFLKPIFVCILYTQK